jgi:hypothetical protein
MKTRKNSQYHQMQPAAREEAQDCDVEYAPRRALTSNAAIDPECVESSQCLQC